MVTKKNRSNEKNISLIGVKGSANTFTGNNENSFERGKHPNSIKNLKPFPKGISGNPMGKPHKYKKLADALAQIGDEEIIDYNGDSKGISY